MAEVQSGATRGSAHFDLLVTNIEKNATDNEVFAPLESEDGRKSDHSVLLSRYSLSKKAAVKWKKYQARVKTDEGKRGFSKALLEQSWQEV